MNMKISQWGTLALAAVVLAGCAVPAASGRRAPVMEYGADKRPPVASAQIPENKKPVMDSEYETVTRIHIVQKGDTLYSIAFINGVDFRDVADWNDIDNPAAIKIGQQLQLRIPVAGASNQANLPRPIMDSQVAEQPVEVKSYPKVGKLAYTESALVQAERLQQGPPSRAVAVSRPAVVAAIPKKQPVSSVPKVDDESPLEWGMPTSGKLVAGFSESDNRKGVDIVGARGQPVVASSSGKVVYSGSGLRGYGKLIIIKHNKTYLSAYAHNDRILVKEGQNVGKGQKIAEMGNSDADQVKLHFEIRKFGKPVDPAKYLPLIKS
ncbi:MAG: peptidoglycan DD-metalloendopeptidase family protein [Sideroxyarcus sp.]|nr:peptidoglycan DD-metalloendopeptidase family protein [Sideroxyarcus sp.]